MDTALTIVIVNWNAGDLLRRCLVSLAAHPPAGGVRTVVVDNASSDGSREMAEREFPAVRVINSGANLGFARGNNLARAHVGTPLVMFLNPDTAVLPGTLDTMIRFMDAHPEVVMLGPRMRGVGGEVQEQGLQNFPTPWTEFLRMLCVSAAAPRRLRRVLPYLDPDRSGYARKLYGGCLLARRSALDRAGWFDERYFMYAEDVDLCRTLQEGGGKLYYLSEAEIIHAAGGASRKASPAFPILMKHESIRTLMRKYYGLRGALGYTLGVFVAAQARLGLLALLRVLSLLTPAGRGVDYGGAFRKYWLATLWCANLRRPVVAGGAVAAGGSHAAVIP